METSLGAVLSSYGSALFDGPVGAVWVGYKGYNCGYTNADTNLMPEQDIKDVNAQQEGTKAYDHVRTGIDYILNVTFSSIKTSLLVLLMSGVHRTNTGSDDSGVIGRCLFQSMRENESGPIRLAAVNCNGEPSEDIQDVFNGYVAIPIVNGDLVQWGIDTQRNFPIQFRLKWHRFASGESSTYKGAFGYWGDPTLEDVPASPYPDLTAPIISTANCPLATSMEISFNKNIAFQTVFDATHFIAKVEGGYVAPTAGVIATDTLTLTFPAATFASGNEIYISISEDALQDTETTPNLFPGVDGYSCTESI